MFKPPMRLEKWIAFDGDVPAELTVVLESDADCDPGDDDLHDGVESTTDADVADIGAFAPFSIAVRGAEAVAGSVVTDEGTIDIGFSLEFTYGHLYKPLFCP